MGRKSPMDVTNCPPPKMEVSKQGVWRCDFCHVATFKDFDEACKHEVSCQKQQQQQQKKEVVKSPIVSSSSNKPSEKSPSSKISKVSKSKKGTAKSQRSFFEPRNKKQKTSSHVAKTEIEMIDISLDNDSKDSGKEEIERTKAAKTVASSSSSNKELAGIFKKPWQQKQLMAEQRKAEFSAKMRMKRKKESEQHQKRQARSDMPMKRNKPAPTNTQSLLPLAPRYPVPNHVLPASQKLQTQGEEIEDIIVPNSWKSNGTTTYNQSKHSSESICTKLLSSPSVLDSTVEEDCNKGNFIQRIIADIMLPPSLGNNKDSRLLVDKYAMDSLLVGKHTQGVAKKLETWINEWRKDRDAATERMEERQRRFKKGYKTKYKNDIDDEDRLESLYLITGPPASGKSSLVHYVAKQCDCTVLEINTTQTRGATYLKNAIQEATQSCSSLDLIKKHRQKQERGALTDFTQAPSEEEDSDYEEEDEPSSSLTVILIDEVDFIYEADGDSGFWSALGSVAKTAKCPIFLTANGFPPSGPRKYKQHIKLQRPTPAECAVKLLQVCRQEQMQFKGGLNGDVVKSKMAFLAEVCDCDLRRAMNELQSYMYANETNQCQDYALLNHAYIQEDDSAKVRASTALPVIQSIEPRVVPTKEYSKVVVRGKNFGFFARCGEEYEVWIGNQICKSHVKNDETLLVLCPPYNPTCGRVPPISIFSKSGQCWTTNKVERLDLIGGSHLDSVQSFSVQYVFPQDLWEESDDTDSNDEENEFEANLSPSKPIGESALENDKEDMKVVEEKGKEMWERILSESPSEVESLAKDTRKLDYELQVGLEALSVASHNLSDAALFEDMQQGLPYLSGACQGLGFELTGGNEGDQGKLKRNENSRPPREDKLFALGWKENCYFFGDADTYVTYPSTSQERRLLRTMESTSRGQWCCEMGAILDPVEEEEEDPLSTDLDELMHQRVPLLADDDKFLPQQIPSLIQSLPSLLRGEWGESWYKKHWTSNQLLDKRRAKYFQTSSYLAHIIGFREAPSGLYPLLPDGLDADFCLHYLPTLRRIAFSEQDSERFYENQNPTEGRKGRQTRSSLKGRIRQHYFENLLQKKLRQNNSLGLTASQIGGKLAESLLVYGRPRSEVETKEI